MKNILHNLIHLSLLVAMLLGGLSVQAQTTQPAADGQYRVYLPLIANSGNPTDPQPQLPPLTINVTPDASTAVTGEIGSEGGQLSATGTDGTAYTLVIPPGALAYTQSVTLTPSAGVAGLPLSGGALGAVQIAPEGLLLMQTAMLTISTPATAGDELNTYGFGFDGTGTAFHLRRSDAAEALQRVTPAGVKIITIRTPKLRGYGAGKGTQADAAQYRQRNRPTRVADQIAEDDLFTPIELDKTIAWLKNSHPEIMNLLRQSASDPSMIEQAVESYVEWQWQLDQNPAIRGQFADHIFQFREGLRVAIKTASKPTYERCVEDQKPAEGLRLQRWLYFLYTYALPMDPSYLEVLVSKCLAFELEFNAHFVREGTIALDGAIDATIESDVQARVQVRPRLNYPQFSLVGASDLTVNHAGVTLSHCTPTYVQGATDKIRVIDLTFKPAANGVLVDTLLFDTGRGIAGTLTIECPEVPPYTADWPLYAGEFTVMHDDEMATGNTGGLGGIFRVTKHWKSGTGDQVATTGTAYHRNRTFQGEYTYVFNEVTTFNLAHRPQP